MRVLVKQDSGVYGLGVRTHLAGQVVDVEPYVGPYGDICPDLFQDSAGFVWPANMLERAAPCAKCDTPGAVGFCQRPNDCLGMAKGGT